ncbi:hypothetical protein DM860_003405 [Cuscuta australis]|uniref:MADS-box domain-containing protein n=1 Tax=Cuscuta australis TaxID=267555 RepID=A0A328DGL7_9ASTE|nr:hypothetical protein DM860_003405 [Cuscuta australis]
MGKGKAKIEIKKIECLQRRNICFTKRRQGLFKKAREICRLYPGTRVAALVFSPAGKPYIFGDPKALFGSEQEEEKGLDGNQFAGLGDLDAVNVNELPAGPDRKNRNRSDWEPSHLGESDSEEYINDPYIFGDPSCLLGAEEKTSFLDGNQMADLGNLDAVMNINKLPGPNEEEGNRSDWDSSQLVDLDESDSDYMTKSSTNEWDLSELASHYMIQSEEDPANANHFVDLGELESMLMDDYFGNDFLGDVETYANQLLEL